MRSPDDPAFLAVKARIKAIFFDLDGTLIDTDDALIESLARKLEPATRLARLGDPRAFIRRALLAAEGPVNRVITLMDSVGLDDNVLSLGDRLRHLRGMRVRGHFVPVDGAAGMIRSLYGSYRLGVITTRSRADALAFLRQFDLEDLLDVVATREDTWRLKPHPQPIHHAVDLLGLSPPQCAMVGDTVMDIRSAKAAGAYAVGVLCGFGEREELLRAGADLVLESTSDVAAWF
jgi:phosphoglycolate phosphatase-like HAD superfamily hydrolase